MTLPSIRGTGGVEVRRDGEARDVTPFNANFEWTESLIEGGWTFRWTFDTEDWKDWEDLLLGVEDTRGGEFRLTTQEGIINGATDWMRGHVDGAKIGVRGRTMSAAVWGGDVRMEMRQSHRTRAWPASSISDVVRSIAAEYGLESDVEDSLGSRDRWQTRMDDWSYIERLAAGATTTSHRGDTYLWVDKGVRIRFGSPELGVPSSRRYDLGSLDNRADKVLVTYHGRAVDRRGGAGLLGVGYDVLSGRPVTFRVDGGAASVHPALAPKLTRSVDGGLRVAYLLDQSLDLVEGSARALWGAAAPRYFSMLVVVRPDLTLRPGSVVELQASINERQSIGVFGRYVVLEVKHVLAGSHLHTVLSCFRREAFAGNSQPTGTSVSFAGTVDTIHNTRRRTRVSAEVIQ